MLYTNQIIKIRKKVFWLYQTINGGGGGTWDLSRRPKGKKFWFSPTEASNEMITTIVVLNSCIFRNKNNIGSLG
jgi:hypothetical protein